MRLYGGSQWYVPNPYYIEANSIGEGASVYFQISDKIDDSRGMIITWSLMFSTSDGDFSLSRQVSKVKTDGTDSTWENVIADGYALDSGFEDKYLSETWEVPGVDIDADTLYRAVITNQEGVYNLWIYNCQVEYFVKRSIP